ncbi:MAG TPA: hypothetical protein VFS67_29585 [Polyangiaceae bacterium]|nr:hypothetical protein [Polyangiaceae bacterium]
MAIIRENGRYRSCGYKAYPGGSALVLLFAVGCVSTDESLFGGADVPDLRPDDAVESTVQTAAPVIPGAEGAANAGEGAEPSQQVLELAPLPAQPPPAAAALPEAPPPPAPPAFEPCASPGLLLCDTFEDEASGAFPALAPWLPELSGCGTHRVDASGVSVSGSQALLATPGGYPECMLHARLPAGMSPAGMLEQRDEVYVRSWVRLGPEPELLENYLTLIELGARAAQDDPELRIGLRPAGGSLCASAPGLDVSVSGLQSGSATGCSGFALEPERWYCLQAHVKRQARNLDYELSVDGAGVLSASGVRLGPNWNDRDWYLKVGRAAYGESAAGSVWHDDVAVGQEPVPCGP